MNFLKDKKNLIIIGLIGIILVIFGYYSNQKNKFKNELKQKDNLIVALNDTVKTYLDSKNRLVSEKKTIQTDLKYFEDENIILKENQKLLIDEIRKISKDNKIIAAAIIDMGIKIKSLQPNIGMYNEKDSSVLFTKQSDSLSYAFRVINVKPSFGLKPMLFIDSLNLYNKQFIEFHWLNERKDGYPVSFTVRNSNPYFKTYDIESYIIPEVQKSQLKPNIWQKTGNFYRKNRVPFAVGVGAGILTYIILK